MSTLLRHFNNVRNFLLTILGTLLPNKFKRYILLTTIYTKGVNEKLFFSLDLQELNNKLALAQDIKAMENISMISNRLWSNVELEELLRESVICSLRGECMTLVEADTLANRIINMTPKWLRYNPTKMQLDISNLFSLEKVYLTV